MSEAATFSGTAQDPIGRRQIPKREAVVEAASRLFKAHGYGQVSMDQVAREAGVSKATLYAHYTSKDELFASILSGACANAVIEAGVFEVAWPDLRTALTAIGGRLLRALLNPDTLALLRVVIAESARFPELGEALLRAGPERFLAHLADWLEARAQQGWLDAPNPRLAADQFGALLRPLVFLRAVLGVPSAPGEAEIDATVRAAVETFLRAYAVNSK